MKNLQREHLKKHNKKKPRKVGPGLHFGVKNGVDFRGFLVLFSSPGPPWGQTGPRASAESPQDGPRPYF